MQFAVKAYFLQPADAHVLEKRLKPSKEVNGAQSQSISEE
jgi:hypothetical protein